MRKVLNDIFQESIDIFLNICSTLFRIHQQFEIIIGVQDIWIETNSLAVYDAQILERMACTCVFFILIDIGSYFKLFPKFYGIKGNGNTFGSWNTEIILFKGWQSCCTFDY